ncbi:putative ribonuclease H-like domain-containing protein [Tanacetum coccineum]
MSRMTSFLWIYKEGLQRPDGIFINQDKYVQEILKKFDLECVRTATTPYEAPKPKSKNEPDSPVNVHLYRSMIGSLMYLTASRPDIMFAVSACSRDWNSTLVMSVSGKVDLMAMQETKQFGYHFPLNAEVAEVVPKSVAGSSFPAASSTLLPFDVQSLKGDYYEEIQISAEGSCVQGKTQADWMLLYVVPTVIVTDDYSRFSWIFFLATKDETSDIFKSFITRVENLIDQRVKVIRCDNGTKFKNKEMNQFCQRKGIKREFSVARTPQQNGVAERQNRTLIEAARTMLADSKLPTTFWAKAVNTACYVQNRTADPLFSQSSKSSPDAGFKPSGDDKKKVTEEPGKEGGDSSKDNECSDQEKEENVNSTNTVNAASTNEVNVVGAKTSIELPDDPNMPKSEDIVYSDDDKDVDAEADMNNLDAFMLNKARLVAQGYTQVEGINYDEVFALVARIEAIRLFLAYASFKDFVVCQMNAKSAFLYGKIEEEVYVCQPPGLEDPDFPDKVYKVEKALYDDLKVTTAKDYIDEYSENLMLKAELAKKEHMVEKKVFNEVENANVLREFVKHTRALRPLDSDSDSACMKSSTSASRSQPSGNTNHNRISQTTSSNMKNKVEDHPRSVKSSSNKKSRVSKLVCNANVTHSMLNANSELIYATCNESMFNAIHDLCVLDFVNDVSVRSKSKSSKRSKKKTTWKPTGKVFTNCPPKNPLLIKVAKKTTPRRNNPEMLKDVTNISLSSRSKGVESNISNNSQPIQNWGSNVSIAPSSSLVNFRFDVVLGSTRLLGIGLSKEDDVSKISTFIFITNFPDTFTAMELFHSCKQYGHVVDVFIPTKRSKDAILLYLDDECLYSKDLSNSLLGRVKEFASLSNLKMALTNEGFDDIRIQYMGELWVLLGFTSEDSKKLFHDNVGAVGMAKAPETDGENQNPNRLGRVRGRVGGFGYGFG